MTRRVLLVSPHFPPDTSAGSHRVRLLAPHLTEFDWLPTVLTIDRRDHEGRLDDGLERLVPASLEVVRCRALPARWTRRFGLGDLGLRALPGLYATCRRLLRERRFDALFITTYPTYPAALGPLLRREFDVPYVVDLQDPWVGSWGLSVGGGPAGRPDRRSRASRAVATVMEPALLGRADAVVAVSAGTYDEAFARHPRLRRPPAFEIPLGGEQADFDAVRSSPASNGHFDPDDGLLHLVYVGTLLPNGFGTLRALLSAVASLRDTAPEAFARVRLHFFGTSNQTAIGAPPRVLPVAHDLGLDDRVTEVTPRIDYLAALRVLTQSTAVLVLGSSERHYTASKLYPALLSRRPVLAVFHAASTVVGALSRVTRAPNARVITYDDAWPASAKVEEIRDALTALLSDPRYDAAAVDEAALDDYSARSMARRLATVLDQVARVGVGPT